ncbi:ThiF family adenylyltransferase [Myroides pelagicus]|uniref:ThiF family adenylyltransferase n=1 Tax=Myroides pelagicus TaxID=270914 RepID=UPI002DB5EEB4|nr:ThiF family adenylyltransferase [Myroides pelagicus]MEC4114947.1 ThiF family adenylyltransferase [Myroides pelagicus]
MEINNILKLRPSIALVINENFTEFFNSNTRETLKLEIDPEISNILFKLNGELNISQLIDFLQVEEDDISELINLLKYLNKKSILINVDQPYPEDSYSKFKRVFNTIEDYHTNQSHVIDTFNKIANSNVVIIGLGAVGTWVGKCLAMSGVRNFTFIDPDCVSISNLHRQIGYMESDVGKLKTESFKKSIKELGNNIMCNLISKELSYKTLNELNAKKIDLIINCADYPTVDQTSHIVGKYCMEHKITHIIGGGYNLHQSLIGQVVIPGKTACVECFRLRLEEINQIDTSNILKLENKGRKVGSFPPLSALSASITANEAFKVLAQLDNLSMTNNRTEFNTHNLNFSNLKIERRLDCNWCGAYGEYFNL